MNTRTTAALLAAGLLAILTACGSDDDKPAAPTPSASASAPAAETSAASTPPDDGTALKAAVAAYTDAYFEGDVATAYGMLSTRCAAKITAEQYKTVVTQAAVDYGPDHPAANIETKVSGTLGHATYTVKGLPKFSQTDQPWVRQDGDWRYNAC